jgi:hypothetical protein
MLKGRGHKKLTVEKRRRNGPECNNGIWNRSLIQQLCLGSKKTFYGALRQTIGLEIVKLAAGSSMRI